MMMNNAAGRKRFLAVGGSFLIFTHPHYYTAHHPVAISRVHSVAFQPGQSLGKSFAWLSLCVCAAVMSDFSACLNCCYIRSSSLRLSSRAKGIWKELIPEYLCLHFSHAHLFPFPQREKNKNINTHTPSPLPCQTGTFPKSLFIFFYFYYYEYLFLSLLPLLKEEKRIFAPEEYETIGKILWREKRICLIPKWRREEKSKDEEDWKK